MLSDIKREAYLNEYKGNIFEYLVASHFARKYDLEGQFISSLSPEFHIQLQNYEEFLAQYSPHLLEDLPIFAKALFEKLEKEITSAPEKVYLIGKVAAGSHDQRWNEADLLISADREYPISIKLCKSNSYVNTKSAGIRSFISKYFHCQESHELQVELNDFVDKEYEVMAHALHQSVDLNYMGSFETWIEEGYSELPGELNESQKKIVHCYYWSLSRKLHEILEKIQKLDSEQFKKDLYPLLGYSGSEIIQATLYHKALNSSQSSNVDSVKIMDFNNFLKNNSNPIILEHKKDVGNFEIQYEQLSLQIRIKPMNTFTAKSVKINCSTKEI
jgi:hypothetical protein